MLPTTNVRAANLSDLRPGELYTSFYSSFYNKGWRFIGGVLAEGPVAVLIEGEPAFEAAAADKWKSSSGWEGWAFKDVRVEVDPDSAMPMPARVGMIALSDDGATFLVAKVGQERKLVRLDSSEFAVPKARGVAFSKWRIVCGPTDSPLELFAQGLAKPEKDA